MSNRKRRGRGEGGIRQHPNGHWEGSMRLPNGKRRYVTAATKGECQEKLRELQNKGMAGVGADPSKLTVEQFLATWLEQATAKRLIRHGTSVRYKQLIDGRIVPHLGAVRLDKLTASHVDYLITEMHKSGISLRGQEMAVNVLSRACKDAVKKKLIINNPVQGVEKPKPPKPETKSFDHEQVSKFLAEIVSDRLCALYIVAIDSGMREGELFGLEWADVDFEAGTLSVQRALKEVAGKLYIEEPKTKKSRRLIHLTRFSLDALHEHRKRQIAEGNASCKLVFCDQAGGWLRRPNVARRSFHPILKRAGLPRFRFHELRHTCGTLLASANEHTKVISERLGHSSTQITEAFYLHVLPTMQKQSAEKLNAMFDAANKPKKEDEAAAG